MQEGHRHGPPAPNVTAGLTKVLLGEDPSAIIEALKGALQRGVPPVKLSKEVAYAAAVRICRFTTTNEFSDWITVLAHIHLLQRAAPDAQARVQQ